MKREKQKKQNLNSIEQTARQIFGYDEDSLCAEMDEAERAWEVEKAANPEAAAKAERDADEGFEKLMDHIKAEGLQPVSEEEYEKAREEEERKNYRVAMRIGRKKKKALLLAAAVCVLGLGSTMAVVAHREYKYNLYPVEGKQNVLVKQNSAMKMDADKLDDAYVEIEEKLGIKALKLGHMPPGMKFKQGTIDDRNAIIELKYKGTSVFLTEEKYLENTGVLRTKASDRKDKEMVYNEWLKMDLIIEKNILQSNLTEYSTYLDGESSFYSLSGKIEKADFIELIEGLKYE